MYNIAIVEASQNVKDGIGLPDICKKLITKAFTLAGSLHEAGDVHDVHSRRNHALWLAEVCEGLKSLVRDICGTEIRLNGAEREIGTLRPS